MRIDDGGPAFPTSTSIPSDCFGASASMVTQLGMSLRDWFAGMALSGMASQNEHLYGAEPYQNMASTAYRIAGAMLADREKSDG